MGDTGEGILWEALRLFSLNGYEAVSMRDIAGRLGISQSAIYKHYAGKREIFNSIVRRMEKLDASRANEYEVPEKSWEEAPESYRRAKLERLCAFCEAQFAYWTEDAFASAFRRLLTLEQYRSDEMQALYQQYLSGGVIAYVEALFRETGLRAQGAESPQELALLFYGPVFTLISLYDGASDKGGMAARVRRHLEAFARRYETEAGEAE